MKISIALATFNGARYLPEQLQSFLQQTRLPDELVVADDGSADETLTILKEFRQKAPFPVRIIENDEPLGHELNFGRAIAACTGDLISLSDQDDVWFPPKLERVELAFQQCPTASIVINDLEITDGELRRTGHTVLQQTRASGSLGENCKSFIIGCATTFRSTLTQVVLPVPPFQFGHDKWIHQIGITIHSRLVIPQPLQLYRRHGSNSSTWAFDGAALATWRDMVAPTKGADLRPAYEKEWRVLEEIRQRLCALGIQEYQDLCPGRSHEESLKFLKGSQDALRARVRLAGAGWMKRKLLALSMLATGRYKYFLGLRSFAKDLIR